MGIYHFVGLGASPGAATAGLSYIRHHYGAHHAQYGDMAEAAILFTSTDVALASNDRLLTEHNDYGRSTTSKRWTNGRTNVVEVVREFLRREMPDTEVFLATVDVHNFDACLQVVGQAAFQFHKPGETGKHIWANITGGTNVLNMAVAQVAYLTGVVARLYYTFIANVREQGKYLQPFSMDPTQFRYQEILTFKTRFSRRQRQILEELHAREPDSWLSGSELLSRLKCKGLDDFANLVGEAGYRQFKTDFLNVMAGRSIEQEGDRQTGQSDLIRISLEGKRQLELLNRPLFRARVEREPLNDDDEADALADFRLTRL